MTAALGRSLHKLGFYHAARRKYETFLENTESDSEGARKIQRRLEQLDKDVAEKGAEVRVESFPSRARILIELDNGDWAEVGRTPFTGVFEESEYRVAIEKPRYRREMQTLQFDSSAPNPRTLQLELVSERSELDMSALRWKRYGLITGGASLAVLGVSGVFFGFTWAKFDETDDYVREADYVPATRNRLVEKAHRFQRTAFILAAVGGTGLATGIGLYVRGLTLQPDASSSQTNGGAPSRGEATSSNAAGFEPEVQPVVNPRYFGIRASW